MANTGLRFWTVEHPFGMLIGVALAHIGRGRIRKTRDAVRKHRTALIFFTLALIVIVISIPWPGRPIIGRPLFRLKGISRSAGGFARQVPRTPRQEQAASVQEVSRATFMAPLLN